MKNSVLEYIFQSAANFPDKIAIKDEHGQVTFKELLDVVRRIATHVCVSVGANQKKPVAVYMEKRWECVACFLGIAYSGNIYSPMDVHSPAERIDRIFSVLAPELVLSMQEKPFCDASNQVFFSDIMQVEPDDSILQKASHSIIDTDPLYILFTSGSTGLPKGVVISHRAIIDYTEWLYDTFAFDDKTIFGEQAPFYFDNSTLDIYSTLKNAGTMVIIPEQKFLFAGQLLAYLKNENVNTIFWVPSALVGVASQSQVLQSAELPSLKKILFCGEVMPNKQMNQWRAAFPEALFANLYGPTEITDVCAYYIVDRVFNDEEPLPIGRACRNIEILVLDENDLPINTVGNIGELCVRGTCLSMGYYKDAERTAKAFVQNPLNSAYEEKIYRTGDLVRYNEFGELDYVCRKDFQIKHQGHRIELGEVETVAGSFSGIHQCCAIYDEKQKKIVLFCSTDGSVTSKQLFLQLKERLPRYMLPAAIELVDVMPLNSNGKIDRVYLKGRI